METIDGKAKVIISNSNNQTTHYNLNSNIMMMTNINGENKDSTGNENTNNRNWKNEIIVMERYSEERVIALTIMSILFTFLLLILISFIYIYICRKYFRQTKTNHDIFFHL